MKALGQQQTQQYVYRGSPIVSAEYARNILGEDANHLSDDDLEKLVALLTSLCRIKVKEYFLANNTNDDEEEQRQK